MLKSKFEPIEMPVSKKYGNDYFVVKSYKIGRVVKLYSNLEFKNWLTLELNPEVVSFCEQPYKAEMFVNGKKKDTIFDMWVLYKSGAEEFQEIKYKDQLTDPKNKEYTRCTEQVAFQKKWCYKNKMPYITKSEEDIELGQFHIENLIHISSRIKRYSHIFAKSFYDKIQFTLKEKSTLTELYNNLACQLFFDEFLTIISFAYYDGQITLSLYDEPLGLNTEVELYGKQTIQLK